MSVFSGLNQLKDALDDVIHDDQKAAPAGHGKTQSEVRSEIHGEERKEHEIQKKSGWSDKVSSLLGVVQRWSWGTDRERCFQTHRAKIKDIIDGDDEEQRKQDELLRLKTEKEKAEARERIKEERGFTGKVCSTLTQGCDCS
jgi:flavodoxin